jgi:hypothetical protein
MPEHYWPGESIDVLPFIVSYSSDFVTALPDGGDSEPLHHVSPTYGGNIVVYSIVGEGRDVAFYATGTYQGVTLALVNLDKAPGAYGYYEAVSLGVGSPAPPDPDYFTCTAALKFFLVSGQTYYLLVGSGGIANDGRGFGQDIVLEVDYASTQSNDLRDDAFDVIIAADGQTYKSPTVFNYGFTHSLAAIDDQSLIRLGTAWWKYEPLSDTTLHATAFTTPENFQDVGVSVYRAGTDGVLTLLSSLNGNPAETTASVQAHDLIYIQIGLVGQPGGSQYPAVPSNGVVGFQQYQLWLTGAKSVVQAPTNDPNKYTPPPPDVWTDPGILPTDPFDPGVIQPTLDTGEDTLLNLVRIFSSRVKRAVRITGPTTIEMVDPAVPLPPGWTAADGNSLYHAASTANTATDVVLATNAGAVTVTGAADLVADDVRLVRSRWRIPDRLPVYGGLPPAPVQHVTLTFTPQGFRASVDFQFPAVPIAARRP